MRKDGLTKTGEQELPFLIFTDLDGTLLDHHTYSYEPALPALECLKQRGIPIILNSSKTLDELQVYNEQLRNPYPVIVENGGALCWPSGYFSNLSPNLTSQGYEVKLFSPSYSELVAILQRHGQQSDFDFQGFHDWDVARIAEVTGLSDVAAAKAKNRLCSEPLLWQGSADALTRFRRLLATDGLTTVQGGRFLHVIGDTDKARAMKSLLAIYRNQGYGISQTIALGDSPNDEQMLEAADIAVVVKNPDSPPLEITGKARVFYTENTGPAGWREAIDALLE